MKKHTKKIKVIIVGTINLNSLSKEDQNTLISILYDNILNAIKNQGEQ
jgi:hypothetical protein